MTKKVIRSVLLAGGVIVTIGSSMANAADDNGCWSGQHSSGPCLEYSTYEKNDKTYFKLHNTCDARLYIGWCADDKCGVDGLRSGQTKTKYEYVTNARTTAWAVGSNNPSQDWVCKDIIGGW